MADLSKYEFHEMEDGIYFGKAKKNGGISSDARKITREEIVGLFSIVLEDYCLRNQTPIMDIMRDGKVFIKAALIIE